MIVPCNSKNTVDNATAMSKLVEDTFNECKVYEESQLLQRLAKVSHVFCLPCLSDFWNKYETEVGNEKKKLDTLIEKHRSAALNLSKCSKVMQRERQRLMQKYNTLEHDHGLIRIKEKQSNHKSKKKSNPWSELSLKKSTANLELMEARKKLEENEKSQTKELQEKTSEMIKLETKAKKQTNLIIELLVKRFVAEHVSSMHKREEKVSNDSLHNLAIAQIRNLVDTVKDMYFSSDDGHAPSNCHINKISLQHNKGKDIGSRKTHKMATTTITVASDF